jgi:hypothetical protein
MEPLDHGREHGRDRKILIPSADVLQALRESPKKWCQAMHEIHGRPFSAGQSILKSKGFSPTGS